jgi:hypothetical protein
MQIRNSWTIRRDSEAAGFVDAADFEAIERQGRPAVERWIDSQLNNTSATIVLIGANTASRPYVQYEIRRSYERGSALLGIYIDNIKDQAGNIHPLRGRNPFEAVQVASAYGATSVASKLNVPIYDWVNGDGRTNIASWLENAPRKSEG